MLSSCRWTWHWDVLKVWVRVPHSSLQNSGASLCFCLCSQLSCFICSAFVVLKCLFCLLTRMWCIVAVDGSRSSNTDPGICAASNCKLWRLYQGIDHYLWGNHHIYLDVGAFPCVILNSMTLNSMTQDISWTCATLECYMNKAEYGVQL